MSTNPWPRLDELDLAPTLGTLHLWSQVAGKVRLALTPWENHGWHVPFYLSPRGFATGLIPVAGDALAIEFDLVADALTIRTSTGGEATVRLKPQTVAAFHASVLAALAGLGVGVHIDPMPTEIPQGMRFDLDHRPRAYDGDVARRYWRALLEVHRVFQLFRTRFTGKVSPIHLFWGAFDLAVTRFSGRAAPRHPGGAPHLNDAVAREAYTREVSSAGFWPNLEGGGAPAFYSYAYPAPSGFAERVVPPASDARFDAKLGEFILPYAAVQAAHDPDAVLLDFLQTSYEAAADLAGWDRALLEREQGHLGRPPEGS